MHAKYTLQEYTVICKWLSFQHIYKKQVIVAEVTICLNKEAVKKVSYTQITFQHCCLVKSWCDASCDKKKCLAALSALIKGNSSLLEFWFIVSQHCCPRLARSHDYLQNMESMSSGRWYGTPIWNSLVR